MERMTENQFSKHGLIEKNISEHRTHNIEEDDQQFIVLVIGDTGTSKTSLSILLEHHIRKGEVNLDTITLDHDKFIQEYTSRPQKKVIIYEEGRNSFDKNKYNTKPVREARDKINQYRKYHHTLLINFQNPHHLTQEIVRNADALLRTPSKGVVHYYSQSKIKQMWDGNTFLGWENANFRDFFPDPANHIPEIWENYEEKTLEKLDSSNKEGRESKDEGEDEIGDYLSLKEVASKLSLHKSTVRRYCKDGKLDFKKIGANDKVIIPEKEVKQMLES